MDCKGHCICRFHSRLSSESHIDNSWFDPGIRLLCRCWRYRSAAWVWRKIYLEQPVRNWSKFLIIGFTLRGKDRCDKHNEQSRQTKHLEESQTITTKKCYHSLTWTHHGWSLYSWILDKGVRPGWLLSLSTRRVQRRHFSVKNKASISRIWSELEIRGDLSRLSFLLREQSQLQCRPRLIRLDR